MNQEPKDIIPTSEPKKDESHKSDPYHDPEDDELGGSMTFLEHLTELRERLIKALAALAVGTVICFIFSDYLIAALLNPIPENYLTESAIAELKNPKQPAPEPTPSTGGPVRSATDVQSSTAAIQAAEDEQVTSSPIRPSQVAPRVIATSPVEGVIAKLKVSVIAGIFLSFPVLFYQAWMFIAPGLYKRERRLVLPLVFWTWFCFITGGLFAYFIIYRFALAFLFLITPPGVENLWKLSEYLSLTTRFLLAFGIVFEEPVVITLLAKIGIVTADSLIKFRPYSIVIMFSVAAIITPPDPISQLTCAIPLVLLYELSILIVKGIERRRQAEADA